MREISFQPADGQGLADRIRTPEEYAAMQKGKGKFRVDGTPREDHRPPTHSFRCNARLWARAAEHAKARGVSLNVWLVSAIEKQAAEEERKSAYNAKKKKPGNAKAGKRKAAAAA